MDPDGHPATLRVRPPRVVDVLRRTHEGGYPARWPDDPAAWLSPPGHLAAWTVDDDPVGHVGLAAPAIDAPLVTRLFVHPDHRVAERCTVEEGGRAGPAARRHRGAWRLYERRGWRMTHRVPADWSKPDGSVPVMRWYEKRLR